MIKNHKSNFTKPKNNLYISENTHIIQKKQWGIIVEKWKNQEKNKSIQH